jgi:hypothetical protein
MDSTQQFIDSLKEAFTSSGNILSFLLLIIGAVGLYVLYLAIMHYYKEYQASLALKPRLPGENALPKHEQEFNPAQKRSIFNIITEFKKKEIMAAAIPDSILERYSEYFYNNIKRVKISDRISKSIQQKIFPVPENSSMEIEMYHNNQLHVFNKKVFVSSNSALVTEVIDNISNQEMKGKTVNVCYTVNNQFICGESKVGKIYENGRMVLSYPKNLIISNERRFSRVPVNDIDGYIVPANNQDIPEARIVLKDISLEGMKVRSLSNLTKNVVYKIRFEDHTFDTDYAFENLECIVSKILVEASDVFEYGMSFIYLDLENRSKLSKYLKDLVNRIKVGH